MSSAVHAVATTATTVVDVLSMPRVLGEEADRPPEADAGGAKRDRPQAVRVRVVEVGSLVRKGCMQCCRMRPREEFSRKQWRPRQRGRRRCTQCILVNKICAT